MSPDTFDAHQRLQVLRALITASVRRLRESPQDPERWAELEELMAAEARVNAEFKTLATAEIRGAV